MSQNLVSALVHAIEHARLDLSDEKRLQSELSELLVAKDFAFVREIPLSARDIPDFLVANRVVIECKLHRSNKRAVFRQLCRYAEYPQVAGVILATNLSMGLPPEHAGTPLYLASLGRGWL